MGGATAAGGRAADAAFDYCARIAAAHYENFPVASLFLPEEKREYIQAVYAFSRAADDFADEGEHPPESRLERLDEWGRMLDLSYAGEAEHPVFIALAETVRRNAIPKQLLSDLLSAFRQDVVKHRYDTMEDLLEYCSRSANPVGRIVLRIFGQQEEELALLSDRICTGLQLANFWQDVGADLAKDRLYIPLAEMAKHAYTEAAWKEERVDDAFRSLMGSMVSMTREMFRSGVRLPELAERDIALELRLVWLGGMAILRRVERSGYRVYASRPVLGKRDKLGILLRGLFMRDLSRLDRPRVKKKPWDLT